MNINQLIECFNKGNITEEELIWSVVTKTDSDSLIAGPWVPLKRGIVLRYSFNGLPLAQAQSQLETQSEDIRLQKLGYLLTDKNRLIPQNWFEDETYTRT